MEARAQEYRRQHDRRRAERRLARIRRQRPCRAEGGRGLDDGTADAHEEEARISVESERERRPHRERPAAERLLVARVANEEHVVATGVNVVTDANTDRVAIAAERRLERRLSHTEAGAQLARPAANVEPDTTARRARAACAAPLLRVRTQPRRRHAPSAALLEKSLADGDRTTR